MKILSVGADLLHSGGQAGLAGGHDVPNNHLSQFIEIAYYQNSFQLFGSMPDNYGRTAVCAKCGDKTGRTSVIGPTISA